MRDRITEAADWLQATDAYVPPIRECRTLDDIVRVSPAVGQILDEARAVRSRRRADWNDYEFYKSLLKSQVGWWSPTEILQTCHCYEVCIKALTDALHI